MWVGGALRPHAAFGERALFAQGKDPAGQANEVESPPTGNRAGHEGRQE